MLDADELDNAREIEAIRIYDLEQDDPNGHGVARIAARLAREGWTPPNPVDPDFAEAETLWLEGLIERNLALAGIKRGRALAAAEAPPEMVWVINCGLSTPDGAPILTRDEDGNFDIMRGCKFSGFGEEITHYAIITPPEEK